MSMNERMRAGWAGVLISAALLSACGGGGGGGDDAPPAPPPVQGVAIPDNLAIAASATTDVASATAFSSNAAATAGLTFAWTFGDGTTSTEASPKHDFAKTGDYDVSLKVSNAAGTSKEVKFAVSVLNRAAVQGLACTAAEQTGWCWQAPRPSGNLRGGYFFLDASQGWTVGDNGEILRTTDGGKVWVRQASGIKTRLTQVRFIDASNGWAIGDFGAVLRTTDGGARWNLLAASTTVIAPTDLRVLNATTAVLIAGDQLRATTDGGATWTESTVPSPTVAADGTVWSLRNSVLKKSADFGRTMTTVRTIDSPSYASNFWVFGETVVLPVATSVYNPSTGYTYTQSIERSADGGTTWETINPQGLPAPYYGNQLAEADFIDANTGAVRNSNNSALIRTADGGRTWTPVSAPTGNVSVSYVRQTPGLWVREVYQTSVFRSDYALSEDEGATWRTYVPAYSSYDRLTRVDARTWLSFGSSGTASLSSDGLQTWTRVDSLDAQSADKTLQAIWFFDAKRGLALSAGGSVLETANGGLDWTVKVAGLANNGWYNVGPRLQFADAKKGWLLAADARLYLTDDGGATWLSPILPATTLVTAFHFIDASTGFALISEQTPQGSVQRLMSTTDGGKSWTVAGTPGGGFWFDLRFTSAQKGVLVGDSGRVATTADGGLSFTGRFSGTGARLRKLTSSDAATLWVVGDAGTLMSSKDDGQSWQPAGVAVTSLGLYGVRFLDAQQGWAVGDGGTVLMTKDGGKNWRTQFSGTQRSLSQVFFVDARTGWIAGDMGTLLATGSGGQ